MGTVKKKINSPKLICIWIILGVKFYIKVNKQHKGKRSLSVFQFAFFQGHRLKRYDCSSRKTLLISHFRSL